MILKFLSYIDHVAFYGLLEVLRRSKQYYSSFMSCKLLNIFQNFVKVNFSHSSCGSLMLTGKKLGLFLQNQRRKFREILTRPHNETLTGINKVLLI